MASTNSAFTTYNLDGFSLRLPKHRSPSEASSGRRSPSPMRKVPRPSTAPAIEQKPVLPSRPLPSNPPLPVNGPAAADPSSSKNKRRLSTLSSSQNFQQEESESMPSVPSPPFDIVHIGSLTSKITSIPAGSPTTERGLTVEESDYDWATFISAYARGKWDPHRTPRPPRSQFITPNHALYPLPEHPTPSPSQTYDEPEVITKSKSRSSTPPQDLSVTPSTIKTALTSPVHLSPEYPRNHSLPLVEFTAHRQRNSFSSSSSTGGETLHFSSSNADHQTTAATLRWAAARVNLSPLALPSPEHELTDPMRGVNTAIPGSHPHSYVSRHGNELLTPGGTRRLRPNVFWRGTQDVELRVPSRGSGPDSDTSTETLVPSNEAPSDLPASIHPSLPPATAPLDRRSSDEEDQMDYFGEPDSNHSDLTSHDLGSSPPFDTSQPIQPALMRLVTVDSGVMSVPAVPRRVCLTRQISSPLPNASAIDGNAHTPPLPSNGRAAPSDYALFRTRAAKEEQMFHELGYLAAPNPPDELERRRALYK
jgi:hypothetical protein